MTNQVNTLWINACVRQDSRTLVLAEDVIRKHSDELGQLTRLDLEQEALAPLCRDTLALREQLVRSAAKDHPMLRYARQLAAADNVIISAPFWDLSFPALLKIYLEHVTVAGITFEYRDCRPVGLCRAKRLIYVTTAGGPILDDFGFSYVKALARNFYGIPTVEAYRAELLDVKGITAEHLLRDADISRIC